MYYNTLQIHYNPITMQYNPLTLPYNTLKSILLLASYGLMARHEAAAG